MYVYYIYFQDVSCSPEFFYQASKAVIPVFIGKKSRFMYIVGSLTHFTIYKLWCFIHCNFKHVLVSPSDSENPQSLALIEIATCTHSTMYVFAKSNRM